MKIAFVVGTRPEIIKMFPLIKEAQIRGIDFSLIHSNQHYSYEMDELFFQELSIPHPHFNLNVGSGSHGNQTGNILIKFEPVLEQIQPDIVLTQGDTNTVLAAALAAAKMSIPVGHVEAGLRSYDRKMPEETNRIVTDHLSDFLFAVTDVQKNILNKEGIEPSKVFVVGNTVVDALLLSLEYSLANSSIHSHLGIKEGEYVLATIHRASNVDEKEPLAEILELIQKVAKKTNKKIVWPIHPRTKKKILDYGFRVPACVIELGPVGYFDFVKLQKYSSFIITDSGGIQEEACALKVPCITVRENTERPETVSVGANFLVARSWKKVEQAIEVFSNTRHDWINPFGDGNTRIKILDIIERNCR